MISKVAAQLGSTVMSGPKLRFCPESNDLLYPKEDRERKKLVYFCRSCGYQEDVEPTEWCVYRNEVHHTAKEKNVVLQVRTSQAAQLVFSPPCDRSCKACASSPDSLLAAGLP